MHKSSFVVIPNWNGIDFIDDCLKALEAQSLEHTVIVVENGSTDGSVEFIERHYPRVQLLKFPDNAGFAGGVNRGIREALKQKADYIALLNNDAVADKYWLQNLVTSMETHPQVGAITAKILTQDGKRLDSTGDFYTIWGWPYPRGRGEADAHQYDADDMREIFAASGGASLYRAAMFEEIGLFDEMFFAYFEDIDIGFRGRLAGWTMLYEPTATVRHFIGGTSSRLTSHKTSDQAETAATEHVDGRPSAFARFHTVKNFAYVYTKNMPGTLYWRYFPRFVASEAMMLVSDIRRGLFLTNLEAHASALSHLPTLLRERRRIQRARKVEVRAINDSLVHMMPPLQRARFERMGLASTSKTRP